MMFTHDNYVCISYNMNLNSKTYQNSLKYYLNKNCSQGFKNMVTLVGIHIIRLRTVTSIFINYTTYFLYVNLARSIQIHMTIMSSTLRSKVSEKTLIQG